MRLLKSRILIPAVLFVLLTGAGTGWLLSVARSAPDSAGRTTVIPPDPVPASTPGPAGSVSEPDESAPVTSPPASPDPASGGGAAEPRPGATSRGASPPATTPPAGTGQAPPVPVRGLRLGGVTLDNTVPRGFCTGLRNTEFSVPVRIVRISAASSEVTVEPGPCADLQGDFATTFACTAGAVLQPGGTGCWTGVSAVDGLEPGDHVAGLVVSMRARCSSAAGEPCARSGAPAPTARRPVDVEWTEPAVPLCSRVSPPGENNGDCFAGQQ